MKFIIILSIILSINTGFGSESPSFGDWIKNEIDSQIEEIKNMEDAEGVNVTTSGYYLNLIRVRIRAKVGLDIPSLVKFEVKPYIELHIGRNDPNGFEAFRPKI